MASRQAFSPTHACCFDARHSVELAGPRHARGLLRVCGCDATRRPRVSSNQDGDDVNGILGSPAGSRGSSARRRPWRRSGSSPSVLARPARGTNTTTPASELQHLLRHPAGHARWRRHSAPSRSARVRRMRCAKI